MIAAMVIVVASWCALVILLAGLGLPIVRVTTGRRPGATPIDDLLLAPLMGMTVVIAFLQIWHVWRPVDNTAAILLIVLSVAGLVSHASGIRRVVAAAIAHPRELVAFALLMLFLANRAIGPGDAYDSGSYHYPVIKWMNSYPVVPGLGNFHPTFGHNIASLLWQALLNVPGSPWHQRANHFGNGVWLVLLLSVSIVGLGRLWRSRNERPSVADVFAALLVLPVMMLAFTKEVSSPRTDMAVAVTGLVVVKLWLTLNTATTRAIRRAALVSIAMLAATMVCLKLSSAVMAFALTAGASIVWWRRESRAWPALGIAAAMSLVLIVPWIGRSIVLTGYPLYPVTTISVNAEWTMPAASAEGANRKIRQWARVDIVSFAAEATSERVPAAMTALMRIDDSNAAEHVTAWIVPWTVAMLITGPLYVILPAIVILCAVLTTVIRRRATPQFWLSMAPPAIATAVWLFSAPEPRFGYGLVWAWAGVAAAMTLARSSSPRLVRNSIIAASVAIATAAAGYRAIEESVLYDRAPFDSVPFYAAGPDHGFHPLPSGRPGHLIWDAPLMTVAPGWDPPKIRLRSATGDLSKGFAPADEPWR